MEPPITPELLDVDLSSNKKAPTPMADSTWSCSGSGSVSEFDQKATKRLLRKIDLVLIPFLSLLYL
jgi:hypothetical protein